MKRQLVLIGVLLMLPGCMTQQADKWEKYAYNNELRRCLNQHHHSNVTLTPAEYAETEQYRSTVDPSLDNTGAIQAVYDKKKAAIMSECNKGAELAGNKARSGPSVSLPVVFVAPLY